MSDPYEDDLARSKLLMPFIRAIAVENEWIEVRFFAYRKAGETLIEQLEISRAPEPEIRPSVAGGD